MSLCARRKKRERKKLTVLLNEQKDLEMDVRRKNFRYFSRSNIPTDKQEIHRTKTKQTHKNKNAGVRPRMELAREHSLPPRRRPSGDRTRRGSSQPKRHGTTDRLPELDETGYSPPLSASLHRADPSHILELGSTGAFLKELMEKVGWGNRHKQVCGFCHYRQTREQGGGPVLSNAVTGTHDTE